MSDEPDRKPASILLGVSGSIAAYKAADLCSKLVQRGHDVTVVMTHAATRLVAPLTFSALTGRPVPTDPFRTSEGVHVEHIDVADRADVMVIAPATANTIAKAAAGIADDLLGSTLLAVRCPVLFAPAMNVNMWNHPSVGRNLETLRGYGYEIIEPGSGYLACGYTGDGRLAEPTTILERVEAALTTARGRDGS